MLHLQPDRGAKQDLQDQNKTQSQGENIALLPFTESDAKHIKLKHNVAQAPCC